MQNCKGEIVGDRSCYRHRQFGQSPIELDKGRAKPRNEPKIVTIYSNDGNPIGTSVYWQDGTRSIVLDDDSCKMVDIMYLKSD
jgi:hypothetical protein